MPARPPLTIHLSDLAGLRITMQDVMAAGHCAGGARRWFHAHDLDFRRFMREGIAAAVFVERGDHLARQVVARKLARIEAQKAPVDLTFDPSLYDSVTIGGE